MEGRRELAFVVVGAINTAIGLALFAGLHHLLRGLAPYLVVLVLTYACGTVIAFVTQRVFVFKVRGHVARDLLRFTLVQMSVLALNAVVLTLAIEALHLPVVLAQCLTLAMIVVVTYLLHLNVSFHRPREAR